MIVPRSYHDLPVFLDLGEVGRAARRIVLGRVLVVDPAASTCYRVARLVHLVRGRIFLNSHLEILHLCLNASIIPFSSSVADGLERRVPVVVGNGRRRSDR